MREIVQGGGTKVIIHDSSPPKPDWRNIAIRKEYERLEQKRKKRWKIQLRREKKNINQKQHSTESRMQTTPNVGLLPHTPKKTKRRSTFLAILLIIILAAIILYTLSSRDQGLTDQEVRIVPVVKTITVDSPAKLSFSEYIDNNKDYDKASVKLTGMLQREIEGIDQTGVYVEYVADDEGNKIRLLSLTKEQKQLFPKTGKTDKVYEINGDFKAKYQGVDLVVASIKETERSTEKVVKKVTVNETRIVYVNKTSISTKLLQSVKKKINPPPTICKDGTLNWQCSVNLPYYCENEQLIENPSKCGCPFNYYPQDEKCIEKTTAIEIAIFEYTNIERTKNKVHELKWSDKLSGIAREHSKDMANQGYFDHVNPAGEDPSDRAERMGFEEVKQLEEGWYTEGIAENIGKMAVGDIIDIGYVYDTPDGIGKSQVKSWMDSPGHRANILETQYTKIGIGVAYDGSYYIATQNFW